MEGLVRGSGGACSPWSSARDPSHPFPGVNLKQTELTGLLSGAQRAARLAGSDAVPRRQRAPGDAWDVGALASARRLLLPAACRLALSDPVVQINYKKPGRNYNCNQVELRSDELQFVSLFFSFFFLVALESPQTHPHAPTHATRRLATSESPIPFAKGKVQRL